MNAQPDYALFGGRPLFGAQVQRGVENLPDWNDVEREIRGIFDRRYFANNGPLVRRLDADFATRAGTRHAVAVTNEMIALMVLCAALEIEGDVILPALSPPSVLEALRWAGLTPVLCDVDRTMVPTGATLASLAGPKTVAVYAFRCIGNAEGIAALESFCLERELGLIIDAGDDVGCISDGRTVGSFGRAEIFSFASDRLVNGAEGATITTNDDALAAKMRTIRNFHAGETFAPVRLRINGKMSEVQAALVLASLRRLDDRVAANRVRYERYARDIAGIPGLALVGSDGPTNYARLLIAVDESRFRLSRDRVLALLRAENVGATVPCSTASAEFPNAVTFARSTIELPNGDQVSPDVAASIAKLLGRIAGDATELARALTT